MNPQSEAKGNYSRLKRMTMAVQLRAARRTTPTSVDNADNRAGRYIPAPRVLMLSLPRKAAKLVWTLTPVVL